MLNGSANGGFHHRANGIDPPNSSVIEILEEFDSGSLAGVYHAAVEICTNGRCATKPSTFFPDAWSKSRVLDEIISAYRIAVSREQEIVPRQPFDSVSDTGLPITIVVDEAFELVTAFPKLPGF